MTWPTAPRRSRQRAAAEPFWPPDPPALARIARASSAFWVRKPTRAECPAPRCEAEAERECRCGWDVLRRLAGVNQSDGGSVAPGSGGTLASPPFPWAGRAGTCLLPAARASSGHRGGLRHYCSCSSCAARSPLGQNHKTTICFASETERKAFDETRVERT